MTPRKVRETAAERYISVGNMKKKEIFSVVQRAEKNFDCFAACRAEACVRLRED